MPMCPNGHRVDDGVLFCHECGAPVGLPAASAEPAPVVASRHGNSNTAIYIFCGVLIAFAVIATAVVLIMNSGGDGSQRPVTAPSTVATDASPTVEDTPSTSSNNAVPTGGTLCPAAGGAPVVGTIGGVTSCGFADNVRDAYIQAGGTGQPLTVTAVSPATHKSYDNVVCNATGAWIQCVGGRNNSAQVFFALQ